MINKQLKIIIKYIKDIKIFYSVSSVDGCSPTKASSGWKALPKIKF